MKSEVIILFTMYLFINSTNKSLQIKKHKIHKPQKICHNIPVLQVFKRLAQQHFKKQP